MHVLITGIGGFIGPRLARNLLEHGHRVSGTWLENTPPPPQDGMLEGADLYHADLMDRSSLDAVFETAQPDAVVHLAGLSSVGDSWNRPGEYFRVNVLGTENLLELAEDRKVVFASSAEVYGPVPEEEQPIREERLPDPRSPYALTKAAAERIALARGAVVARAFNLVGPGQASGFVLPSFAGQLAAISRGEQSALKVGNLSARRDFVHVDDGADAFRVLTESGQSGLVYNIAGKEALSISEVLGRLCAVAGVEPPVEEDPERMRPVDVPLLLGDNRRLRELGWEPCRTLDQALADLWASL